MSPFPLNKRAIQEGFRLVSRASPRSSLHGCLLASGVLQKVFRSTQATVHLQYPVVPPIMQSLHRQFRTSRPPPLLSLHRHRKESPRSLLLHPNRWSLSHWKHRSTNPLLQLTLNPHPNRA